MRFGASESFCPGEKLRADNGGDDADFDFDTDTYRPTPTLFLIILIILILLYIFVVFLGGVTIIQAGEVWSIRIFWPRRKFEFRF